MVAATAVTIIITWSLDFRWLALMRPLVLRAPLLLGCAPLLALGWVNLERKMRNMFSVRSSGGENFMKSQIMPIMWSCNVRRCNATTIAAGDGRKAARYTLEILEVNNPESKLQRRKERFIKCPLRGGKERLLCVVRSFAHSLCEAARWRGGGRRGLRRLGKARFVVGLYYRVSMLVHIGNQLKNHCFSCSLFIHPYFVPSLYVSSKFLSP